MKNEQLLFSMNPYQGTKKKYNDKIRIKPYNIKGKMTKCIVIKCSKKLLTGTEIRDIIQLLQRTVEKYRAIKLPIVIDIGNTEFYDKLVFVILECIIHTLIEVYGRQVKIIYNVKDSIWTEGFRYSCLNYVNSEIDMFKKKFEFDISSRHFRKLFTYEDYCDKAKLSKLMTDIKYFLKNNQIDEKSVDELTEVLVELVGNSGEHAKTDCLIDLDLTGETYKKNYEDDDFYYGLNVCVINFSEELFYQPLRNKMDSVDDIGHRYNCVRDAKHNHEKYFSDKYREEDFYMISSFQDKISGSRKKSATGGRGLTSLISSLGERAADQFCYVASGHRALFFFKEHMRFNREEFIGFNSINDYINAIPEKNVLNDVDTFLPGTMYNLSFVINKEKDL